ncbi:hypothetical protein ACSBR2_006708 [Camellia fascicularis]
MTRLMLKAHNFRHVQAQLTPLRLIQLSFISTDKIMLSELVRQNKFVIGDDFDNDEQAQQILDRKAYLLYKDWRYTLKQEFLELEENGVDDPYNHPPSGKRSKAGKANKDDMVNLQVVATDAGLPLTHEELSRQVLGAKKNYLRGCGIGPQPSSTASSAARARDKHMESMRAELEVLREERQRDHKELLKEKKERQRDHKELLKEKEELQRDHEELVKEKEERQRDREEIMREREELMKQIEEGKTAREAQQVQLNHLNDVVSRLTTLLQGSDGHPTIQ